MFRKSDFYTHLLSDSSSKYFPQNVTSEFTTRLAQEEILSGQWKVALCNIYYHRTWVNIAKPEDGKMDIYLYGKSATGRVEQKNRSEAFLEPGSYSTPKALISAIYEKFKFIKRWDSKKTEDRNYFALSDILHINHNPSTNKLSFAIKENSMSCHAISLNFSDTLLDLMGHHKEMDASSSKYKKIELVLDGVPNDNSALGAIKTLSRPSNMQGGIYNLFVYSSLVQNTTVGDVQVPLLRIVPVGGDVGDYHNETFEDRQYIPLQSHTFNTIEVLIGDRFGNRVKFNHGSTPVILVLHFKRSIDL
jgi:hypothetical protein